MSQVNETRLKAIKQNNNYRRSKVINVQGEVFTRITESEMKTIRYRQYEQRLIKFE